MFTNEELVSLNILCRVYVEARSHDGKYYSRNSMTAIHAGLDRFLNKENTNYTMFTDRVFITDSILTVFKPVNATLNTHLVELAREVKILSTKHKPHDTPRCRNSLRKEAACPRTASTILSDCEQLCQLLAPFKVK